VPVPDTNQVQKALEGYYQEKLPEKNSRVSNVEHLQKGIGNLMYAFQIEYLSEGKIRREGLILRMNRHHQAKEKEFHVLKNLKYIGIAVPVVYDLGKDMLGYSFIIMEKLEGENMPISPIGTMTEAESANVWKQFANFLADIHRIDWQKTGFDHLAQPEGEYGYINQILSLVKEGVNAIGGQALNAVFAWLENNKPATDNYVLLHGDYYPNNALIHKNRITGIVDWDGVGIGDAAFDVCEIPLFYRFQDPTGLWSTNLVKRFLYDYREANGSSLDNLEYYLTLKALLFMSHFLQRSDIDPNWRLTVLGGCSEIILEKTGVRILESALYFRKAQIQYSLILSGKGGDWSRREQYLKKAVEADPNLLAAYQLLANSYMQRLGGRLSIQEARSAAHEAIGKALKLDPESPGTLFQLAQINLNLDLDYKNADVTFRKVLEHYSGLGWCHLFLARIALREGRSSQALNLLISAAGYNAGEEQVGFLGLYAWFLFAARAYDRSLKVYADRSNHMLSGEGKAGSLRIQATALINLGRTEEAKPLLAEAWDLDGSLHPEAFISGFALIGEKKRAEGILANSQSQNKHIPADGYMAVGDLDNTFKAIRTGIENQDEFLLDGLRTAEVWDKIRGDSRFDELIQLQDSKEIHTEQYLEDHDVGPSAAS